VQGWGDWGVPPPAFYPSPTAQLQLCRESVWERERERERGRTFVGTQGMSQAICPGGV
jgi:hypothetical protein